MPLRLALKVDVDTDRGTREGVPNLIADCHAVEAEACFLFSLGPDQTGAGNHAGVAPRLFQKVSRTSVVQIYGVRTLLNGTLLPAPHIGRRNTATMRLVRDAGYEIGIHCHNHYRWQDYLHRMSLAEVREEFVAARAEFLRIFGSEARTAGAPGWQSSAHSRAIYDEAGLLYASDTRGGAPFFPRIDGKVFNTLEIPSTLPTFDELMGRPEYPDDKIVAHYLALMRAAAERDRQAGREGRVEVFTLHAEIEGMGRRALFQQLLAECRKAGVEFVRLDAYAQTLLANRAAIPVRDQVMAEIDGRSGFVAAQAA